LAPTESQSPNVSCTEKYRLWRAYSFAIADFSRAVQVLNRYTGTMDREEYERLRNFANQAEWTSEQARRELERHAAEHGC